MTHGLVVLEDDEGFLRFEVSGVMAMKSSVGDSSRGFDVKRASRMGYAERLASGSAIGTRQRHDVLLTRLTRCTLLTMHYGGRLEALGPSFILSPLKLRWTNQITSLSFSFFFSLNSLALATVLFPSRPLPLRRLFIPLVLTVLSRI